jgi:hypothetical protein
VKRTRKYSALLTEKRSVFHKFLLEKILSTDKEGIPNIADKGSKGSIAISRAMVKKIGASVRRAKDAGQTSGHQFEGSIAGFIRSTFTTLGHLRPGTWLVLPGENNQVIDLTSYNQYAHLGQLNKLIKQYPELQATLGAEYLIKPDVVVLRAAEDDRVINDSLSIVDEFSCKMSPFRGSNNDGWPETDQWFLHASISCKWTLRSDRAQNARSEALNLIRNRKGRVPHIAAVTAEPLPMRLASLAMGTSDLDCVYHVALDELIEAVEEYAGQGNSEQKETLDMLIEGRRLRDISDLPLDLVI